LQQWVLPVHLALPHCRLLEGSVGRSSLLSGVLGLLSLVPSLLALLVSDVTHACCVQNPPSGAQIPQLALQQYVCPVQTLLPHEALLDPLSWSATLLRSVAHP